MSEREITRGHIPPGALVTHEGKHYLVVRQDRCHTFKGRVIWMYWIREAFAQGDKWIAKGLSRQCPEKYLHEVDGEFVDEEVRADRSKGK